jgi:hypothetical protein
MKGLYCLAAAAAGLVAIPASAAVTFNTYDISFTNGTAIVSPGNGRNAPGEYQDTYLFTLDQAGTFSGSLTTQQLLNPAGNVVSDIDFGNSIDGVTLDGSTPFTLPSGGGAGLEVVNLGTTSLAAGLHKLIVNYTVAKAGRGNAAAYAGPVNFAPAVVGSVPETATWALFVAAFGLVGSSLRLRRSRRVSFV